MALILNIDTSTTVCSVNLAHNGEIIAIRESREDKSHARLLTLLIEEVLEEAKLSVTQISAIAISMGPGSYTGLRIGVSTAKGLCYGADIPLIATSTLQSLAYQVSSDFILNGKATNKDWFCPMIDARRMEVYTAFYNSRNKAMTKISAEVIDIDSFASILNERKVFFFGNGSDKCKNIIKHKNAVFIDSIETSSKGMVKLSQTAFEEKKFENVAYFEPFYLKDFLATIPKKKLF